MKDIKIFFLVLVIYISIFACGCSNAPSEQHDTKSMGPMPTNAPVGSPYHKDANGQLSNAKH